MGLVSGYFTIHAIEEGIGNETIYCVRQDFPNPFNPPASEDRDGFVPSGWSASPLGVNGTNKYRFICKRTKMDGHWGVWSTPVLDTRYGGQPSSVLNYYAANNSQTTPPSISEFSTDKPTLTNENRVLWNYELVYLDNGEYYFTPTHVMAVLGDKGDSIKGDPGKGISNILEYYLVSKRSSGVTRDDTTEDKWKLVSSDEAVPAPTADKRYLWNYEKIVYTDETEYKGPPHVIGVYGEKGAKGDSIKGDPGIPGDRVQYMYYGKSENIPPDPPKGGAIYGWQQDCPALSAFTPYIFETSRWFKNGVQYDWGPAVLKYVWAAGKDGDTGDKGAKLRMRTWNWSDYYCQGKQGEDFYDVVEYNKSLYLCVTSHQGNSSIVPGIHSYWEPAANWTFIATSLLLATKINADQIDATGIVANDVEITGKITATSGRIGGLQIVGDTLSNANLTTAPSLCLTNHHVDYYKLFYVNNDARSGAFTTIESKDTNALEVTVGKFTTALYLGRNSSYDGSFYALDIESGGQIRIAGKSGESKTVTVGNQQLTFTQGILTSVTTSK